MPVLHQKLGKSQQRDFSSALFAAYLQTMHAQPIQNKNNFTAFLLFCTKSASMKGPHASPLTHIMPPEYSKGEGATDLILKNKKGYQIIVRPLGFEPRTFRV